jgi:hypothetical protein
MKTLQLIVVAFAILIVISAAAVAQTTKADVAVFHLGDQTIRIPAPEDFEEAASQFEPIRKLMTSTEASANDMLAVHLPHAVCEKLRAGEFGPFNLYTKVSVVRSGRGLDFSAASFADTVALVRKTSSQLLDVNGPTVKGAVKQLDKGLSEFNKRETQIDFNQPVNLGEFDSRPNVYSVMFVMSFTAKMGENEKRFPLLAGVSFVRIKQRLVFVYTYRKYTSVKDVEVLRDFTREWMSQILAAN